MSERITTVNLHTHTRRCKHARGIPADYAKAAEEKGIRVLGMTDHTPFPDDRVIMIRMGIAELDDYIREVREAQADYPKLKILLGLECEYFPEFDDFYRMLREEKKMDYLIGSVHFYMYKGKPKGFWNGFVMDREALQSYADAGERPFLLRRASGSFRGGHRYLERGLRGNGGKDLRDGGTAENAAGD